jgi:hypothetical protein
MKNRIFTFVATSLLLVGTLLAPYVRADEEDKKTVVTFNEPVQVPGTVLPAGKYVFKLADSQSDRHIVQIFNADETRLFATILAIPDYRTTPSDKTIVTFDERPSGQPEALRTWFYPGDNYGQEFVYPKQKASELAQVNRRSVPAIPDEATEPVAIKAAPITQEVVAPPVVPNADPADAPTDTSTTVTTAVEIEEEIEELPQTASPLATAALLGIVCLAGAVALRRFSKASK